MPPRQSRAEVFVGGVRERRFFAAGRVEASAAEWSTTRATIEVSLFVRKKWFLNVVAS